MMHMTFYWGKTATILFDSWKTNSWTSYSLTLLALFIVATFYQYLEDKRLRFKIFATGKSPSATENGVGTPLLGGGVAVGKWRKSARIGTAVLFGVNAAIGYMLMLSVMSFNGGVFIAIVVGLAVGYLLFRIDDGEEVVVVVTDGDNSCAC